MDEISQHEVLRRLHPPYVYNYHLNDTAQFLAAAQSAYERRFDRFVPKPHRLENVQRAICANLLGPVNTTIHPREKPTTPWAPMAIQGGSDLE